MRPLSNAFSRNPKGLALFLAFILYGCCRASTHPEDNSCAECVEQWDFGADEDARRDGWPDGWTRQTGQDYPKFIPIAIYQNARSAEEKGEIEGLRRMASQCSVAWEQRRWPWQVIPERVPPSIDKWLERTVLNPYLRFQMDGGKAEVFSAPVAINTKSVYYLTASVQSASEDFAASAQLRFLDENRKILFEVPTKSVSQTKGWQSIATDSQYAYRDDIRFVQVVLQVQPKSSKAFRGELGFDNVRLYRTPRLGLSVNKPGQIYRLGEDVIATCTASGMKSEQSSIQLSLIDHNGDRVASVNKLLTQESSTSPHYVSNRSSESGDTLKAYWNGSCEWKIPSLEAGYYEIRTQFSKGRSGLFELEENFVVLPDNAQVKADSRFGWTLNDKAKKVLDKLDSGQFVELVRQARVGKVKLPIWFDSKTAAEGREIAERVDRLQLTGIACVGVIGSPPESIRSMFPRLNETETGSAFEHSALVQSYLEPVMRQMCSRISEFQLGWDNESDFAANPRIAATLEAIANLAKRYGQEPQIVASHSPSLPTPKLSTIDRWHLYSSEPLTADETRQVLERKDSTEHGSKLPWLSLNLLRASRYSLPVRVQDLTARMIAVTHYAGTASTTAWVTDPISTEVGMLDDDAGPREMFLPFRNVAGALAGARHGGSLDIPSLSTNHLVLQGNQGRLIAWSTHESMAQLYLGENVSGFDVWGRKVAIENINTRLGVEQRFLVGRWPVILEGIDVYVAKWRMGVKIEEKRIDPIVGESQQLKIQFSNPFPKSVKGSIRVIAPSILAEEATASLELDANETASIAVQIQLRSYASTAISPVKLEFIMNTSNPVKFVVDQELQVGTEDFEFDPSYEIDEGGNLRLIIDVTNRLTTPISFDCMLLIPGRPRERTQISQLVERASRTLVLENAKELFGKTLWLRCEQIGTNRILNYPIEITP